MCIRDRRYILEESETQNKNIPDSFQSINMKHVMYWRAHSWEKITYSTSNKTWNKVYDGLPTKSMKKRQIFEEEENYENLVEITKGISGCEEIEESYINEWLCLLYTSRCV